MISKWHEETLSAMDIRHMSLEYSNFRKRFNSSHRFFVLASCLTLAAFVQLNLQRLIYDLLGIDQFSGESGVFLFSWLIVPVFLWCAATYRQLIYRFQSIPECSLWAFAAFLLAHALLMTHGYGIKIGIMTFFSWGLWIPLYLLLSRYTSEKIPSFVLIVFLSAGVFNALFVLQEVVSGIPIFKMTTVLSVKRLYGVSQSVVIVGLQLAVGTLASLYFLTSSKSLIRYVAVSAFAIQFSALLFNTARGPLVYLCGVLLFVLISLRSLILRKSIIFLLAIFLMIIVFVKLVDLASLSDRLNFVKLVFTTQDVSNFARFQIYKEGFAMWTQNSQTLLLGHGAGRLSVIAKYIGDLEFGVESSLLKLLMECGLCGSILILIPVLSSIRSGLKLMRTESKRHAVLLLGILFILLLQSLTHEALKSWLIQFYFWAVLGSLGWLWNNR